MACSERGIPSHHKSAISRSRGSSPTSVILSSSTPPQHVVLEDGGGGAQQHCSIEVVWIQPPPALTLNKRRRVRFVHVPPRKISFEEDIVEDSNNDARSTSTTGPIFVPAMLDQEEESSCSVSSSSSTNSGWYTRKELKAMIKKEQKRLTHLVAQDRPLHPLDVSSLIPQLYSLERSFHKVTAQSKLVNDRISPQLYRAWSRKCQQTTFIWKLVYAFRLAQGRKNGLEGGGKELEALPTIVEEEEQDEMIRC